MSTKSVDGKEVGLSQENLDEIEAVQNARQAARPTANVRLLYQGAMSHQSQSCDTNFYALIIGIKAAILTKGVSIPAKCQECVDWLDSIWNEYYARKAAAEGGDDPIFDFSSFGPCPHSFADVRAEYEAL